MLALLAELQCPQLKLHVQHLEMKEGKVDKATVMSSEVSWTSSSRDGSSRGDKTGQGNEKVQRSSREHGAGLGFSRSDRWREQRSPPWRLRPQPPLVSHHPAPPPLPPPPLACGLRSASLNEANAAACAATTHSPNLHTAAAAFHPPQEVS